MLDDLAALNEGSFARFGDPEIQTRIAQYEMAFRMQTAAPEIVDLSDEPESTFKLYGEDARRPGTYAYNCLLARRLAERDVRFVQLFHRGWDQHGSLVPHLTAQCKDTDQASAALVTDLEQRGLLEDTLVIWGGEFGRTSYSQGGWATAATTTAAVSRSGWLAAASNAAASTAQPMSTATTSSKTRCISTT
jgi:hypothetical protein